MMTLIRNKIIFCAFALVLAICSRCTDESLDPNTRINFRLKSPQAMDGKIRIDEAYLTLSRIEINGGLQNERTTNIVHSISDEEPPYHLTDSSSRDIDLRLPPAMYDQLVFNLVLFADTYQLVMTETPGSKPSDPVGSDSTATGSGGTGGQPAEDDHTDEGDNSSDDHNGSNDPGNGDDDEGTGSGHDDSDGNTPGDQGGDDHHKDDKHKGKKDKDKGDKDHGHGDHRTSDTETAGTVNLDDFFQNAKPGMVVIGTYENNGKTVRLIFVASDVETLSVPARQGDSPVVIIGNNSIAQITFDPERWFSPITPADIESAMIQVYQGQPVLFIHPDYNSTLYDALIPHLQESADLDFGGDNF